MGDLSRGFVLRFLSDDATRSVYIEDNGKVGYAYLLDATKQICGDVWLYNRGPGPTEPEWGDETKAPFANPESYVNLAETFSPPESLAEVSIKWQCGGGCALVLISGKLVAKLADGTKPGWALLAAKDGPLAKVLK